MAKLAFRIKCFSEEYRFLSVLLALGWSFLILFLTYTKFVTPIFQINTNFHDIYKTTFENLYSLVLGAVIIFFMLWDLLSSYDYLSQRYTKNIILGIAVAFICLVLIVLHATSLHDPELQLFPWLEHEGCAFALFGLFGFGLFWTRLSLSLGQELYIKKLVNSQHPTTSGIVFAKFTTTQ